MRSHPAVHQTATQSAQAVTNPDHPACPTSPLPFRAYLVSPQEVPGNRRVTCVVLWLGGLHGELADDAVVAGLGVGADLPGVDPDQIGVTLEHNVLTQPAAVPGRRYGDLVTPAGERAARVWPASASTVRMTTMASVISAATPRGSSQFPTSLGSPGTGALRVSM